MEVFKLIEFIEMFKIFSNHSLEGGLFMAIVNNLYSNFNRLVTATIDHQIWVNPVRTPYPKKVCFEALIVVFHFLFEQKPAPAPSFLLNNNKDNQFKKGTELLSSKLSHSCQSLSIDRYAKGCVTSFLSSVFKFHLTLLHPVAEQSKIVSSAI